VANKEHVITVASDSDMLRQYA